MTSNLKPHAARTGSITFISNSGRYRARMMIAGVNKYVGMYATREEAQKAINDILFDIENGQYTDPAQTRKAIKAAKDTAAQQQRAQKIQERYEAWQSRQPKPDWD